MQKNIPIAGGVFYYLLVRVTDYLTSSKINNYENQ